jgi:hypothetical protein
VVVAHPDDELLGLGATIYKLIHEKGCTVRAVILGEGITSRSDARDTVLWEKELLEHRSNIEQARVNLDSTGWQANVDLSYFRQEFDDDLTTVTGRFSAQKKDSKVYLLFLADAGYSYSQEDVFTNYKLGHVRASVKCAPRIRWEAFVQAQDNRPLGIQFRSLMGTGPRARLFANEHGRLYGGTTAMLENEWSTSGIKDHWVGRSSNYINFNWSKENKWGIASGFIFRRIFKCIGQFFREIRSKKLFRCFQWVWNTFTYASLYESVNCYCRVYPTSQSDNDRIRDRINYGN